MARARVNPPRRLVARTGALGALAIVLTARAPLAQTPSRPSPARSAVAAPAAPAAMPAGAARPVAPTAPPPPRASTVRWPLALPALGALIADPGDNRDWTVATRVDPQSVTIIAAAPGGALAVTLRRARQPAGNCQAQLEQLLHTDAIESFRARTPAVFAGTPWEGAAYRQNGATHDAEFGCLRVGADIWLATALAEPRASVGLPDVASMAERLASAVASPRARRGFPLVLEASGLEIDDPSDDATWLFIGRPQGFPIASDAVSSSAGATGGVTLTVGRRPGNCVGAWEAFRAGLSDEGARVDRPGYVPAAFGARIRRITMGERMRELYCMFTPRGATLVTAVFRTNDGDAMTRMGPMLRAFATAAVREAIGR